jgi:hypothetical protein
VGQPKSTLDVVWQSDLVALQLIENAAVQLRSNLTERIANGARIEPGPLHFEDLPKKYSSAVSPFTR